MNSLSPDATKVILSMYDNLVENIRKERKKMSVWEYIFNVKNNTRYDKLYSSAIGYLANSVVAELKSEQLIRDSKDVNMYILTARGVLFAETIQGIETSEILMKIIDERFFKIEYGKVSDRHKIILFSMLMIRCFSIECCIDAKKDSFVKDKWFDIFLKAEGKLKEFNVIDRSKSIADLGKKSGIEHPMSNLIRHTDDLSKKVKMLYDNSSGDNRYFLNILYPDGEVNPDNLEYMLEVIFEDKIDYSMIDDLSNFLNDSTRSEAIYVLDLNNKNFLDAHYDELFENALISIVEKNQGARSKQLFPEGSAFT